MGEKKGKTLILILGFILPSNFLLGLIDFKIANPISNINDFYLIFHFNYIRFLTVFKIPCQKFNSKISLKISSYQTDGSGWINQIKGVNCMVKELDI